jgi:DNA-binding transcriptional LysR family regulator
MRFNGLDLNLLVALDAVLSEMNISRAAERVFLSQSAMSSALGRLREYFQDDLVVPVGRKLVMTPLAESIAQPVRDVLMRVDTAITTRPVFEPSQAQRRFSLLASDYTTAVVMPPLLARAAREAPGVGFDLRSLTLQAGLPNELLERGLADLLIIPELWVSEAHPTELLWEDSYVCIVSADNDRVGASISFDEYLALGHVAVEAASGRPTAFDAWFLQQYGVTRRVEVATPHFSDVPRFVVGTKRVAVVQRKLAQVFRHLPLRFIEPPLEIPPVRQMMQWHKYRSLDPGLAWLRRAFIASVPENG